MRLLSYDKHGELRLSKDLIDDVPPYAILSHTWGADDDEITFHDLKLGPDTSKAGHPKIQFCGEQARKDGLEYFWVDTCCVDKANHAELSEAIASMFKWYRNATKCYVYLADVSITAASCGLAQHGWESAFRRSRWFTRGWTLQELLAPASVEFFGPDRKLLGSKETLQGLIQEITQIPILALQGGHLSSFSIDERLRWATGRKTKRAEDRAYCLLGIFDVFLPLIYGEGENAFKRLKEEIDKRSGEKRTSMVGREAPMTTTSFGVCLGQAPQIAADAFIGRAPELQQLRDWLTPANHPRHQCVVSVVAMGGMGKTQLSLAHVRECGNSYSSVFWLNAKDEASLRQDMVSVSTILFHDYSSTATQSVEDEKLQVEKVRRWLSEPGNDQWLLVLDNYDDPYLPGIRSSTGFDIRPYLPTRSQGSIIITSRSTKLSFSKQLRLQNFKDIDTSIEILSQRSGRDLSTDSKVSDLAGRLGGLPLALATAGTYLGRNAISCGEYLEFYKSAWEDLIGLDTEELLEYEARTMATTWTISLHQVRSQNEDAAELLMFLAYLGHQDIWYELIKAGASDEVPWMARVTESKIHFQRAMSRLHDYSLVGVVTGSYQIHPCLHDWLVQSLQRRPHTVYFVTALTCVAESVQGWEAPTSWRRNRRLLDHVDELESSRFGDLWHACALDMKVMVAADSFARLHKSLHQPQVAEKMFKRALATKEKGLGPGHVSTLHTIYNLGNLYSAQGQLEAAREMYQRALSGYEETLGPHNISTLEAVSGLGHIYREQGKPEVAEQMFKRALAVYEKTRGPDHAGTLNISCHLGTVYSKQGKAEAAKLLLVRALAGFDRTLGHGHPLTLDAAFRLGVISRLQGEPVAAELLFKRVVAGFENNANKPNQPRTLNTVSHPGTLDCEQDAARAAEPAPIDWAYAAYFRKTYSDLTTPGLPARSTISGVCSAIMTGSSK